MFKQKMETPTAKEIIDETMRLTGRTMDDLAAHMDYKSLRRAYSNEIPLPESKRRHLQDLGMFAKNYGPRFVGRQSQEMGGQVQEQAAPHGFKSRTRSVPVLTFVQAGQMSTYDEVASDWQNWVATDCPNPKAFALQLRGDSMAPEFPADTIITVMPEEEPRNGCLVVAKMVNDDAAFKIYQRQERPVPTITLSSYNPAYKAIEYHPEDFRWIWPVYESRRYH